jgi:hypothetical protein
MLNELHNPKTPVRRKNNGYYPDGGRSVLVGRRSTVGDAVSVGTGVDVTAGIGVIVWVGDADGICVGASSVTDVALTGMTVAVAMAVCVSTPPAEAALADPLPPPLPDTINNTATTTMTARIARQPARRCSGCCVVGSPGLRSFNGQLRS